MQPHAANPEHSGSEIGIRSPTLKDAAGIWRLVCDCDVLDTNSCYAYLLICRDFAGTSLVATMANRIVGFVAAYIPPTRPNVLFVWQIGVGPEARKGGVAKSLLCGLVGIAACRDVQYLEATVTPSNAASQRLFRSVSEELKGDLHVLPGFTQEDFGTSGHEPEETIRIQLARRE